MSLIFRSFVLDFKDDRMEDVVEILKSNLP
jgi:hypothetical protein